MKCPNCQTDLAMTDRQNINVDYCPRCRGFWLEKGRLDQLLEATSAAQRIQEYQIDDDSRHDDRHGYGGGKRRGGY
jgi:hypothetical protein